MTPKISSQSMDSLEVQLKGLINISNAKTTFNWFNLVNFYGLSEIVRQIVRHI